MRTSRCCYLFKPDVGEQAGGDTFVSERVSKWNKALQKFKTHVGGPNSAHNIAWRSCEALLNQKQHIETFYSKMSNQADSAYRIQLTASVEVLRFLLRQGLAFCGNDESEDSINQGSLLIGRTANESTNLKRRVKQLSKAGLRADYLSCSELQLVEPALMVGNEGGAAFLPDDCQLDAQRTVAYIEKANRQFALKGRYAEFYHDPVTCLLRSGSSGEVEAVQTSKNTLYSKKAIIMAAGSWSGSLMHDLFRESDIVLDVPVKPRKGHLLVLENFNSFQLSHGLMEMGYVDHQVPTLSPSLSASGSVEHEQTLSISMTATMDAVGNLLLGSSRQLAGFGTEVDESIIDRIWRRAAEFFPTLRELRLTNLSEMRKVRVGLRPFMPDGKPIIGPVPGLSNMFLATGHEGEGLSMALGTAELVVDMVLGNDAKVDNAPFAVQGRC